MQQFLEEVRDDIKRTAEALNAQYPQYAGHWDGWGLARTNKWFRLKSGNIEQGAYVLLSPKRHIVDTGPYKGQEGVVVYDPGRDMDTSLLAKDITVLLEPVA